MNVLDPGILLSDATSEVLENMFFTIVIGESTASQRWDRPWISARLSFDPRSRCGVSMPLATGRNIAASFLALDPETVSEKQIGEVVCELANMLCGSMLSRLGGKTLFKLAAPALDPPDVDPSPGPIAVYRTFELDEGPLTAWLDLAAEAGSC